MKKTVKKTAKKKTAARSVGKTSADSSPGNRFAGEPRVFRFWQERDGFLAFAEGLWNGEGVHGDPDKDGEYRWMHAHAGSDGIEISMITSVPRPRRRGLLGLFASRKRQPLSEDRRETIRIPAAEFETDVDLATAATGGHRIDLQVIDNDRLYVVLRALGAEGRIEFAGALGRTRN